MGKGLAYAAIGAVIGAIVWVMVIKLTGWSLWVLAPIVGGGAGYGMMRGTQMRGGLPAGVIAAAVTLVAIFAARYFIVAGEVRERLALDESEIIGEVAWGVANEWVEEGYEVYDEEEGDFIPAVYEKAAERWGSMSEEEQGEYVASLQEEASSGAEVLTPIGLLFDFGIFGTICAALAAGTALKTASVTLEEALIERGHAADSGEAADLASDLRAADGGRRA